MASQPGACIVTAVLQTGFAIVDTTAYGDSEVQIALDTQICSDQEKQTSWYLRCPQPFWPTMHQHFPIFQAMDSKDVFVKR